MVARILSGYSIRGLLNYNESKVAVGDATLILANRFAVEVEKLDMSNKIARFERLNKLNGRAKRNAMHIMLNFDRSDKLSQDKITRLLQLTWKVLVLVTNRTWYTNTRM